MNSKVWLDTLKKTHPSCALRDDSRRVEKGDVFFSFPNASAEIFIAEALKKGASFIVTEKECASIPTEKTILVDSVFRARLEMADSFYYHPFKDLKVHGVTGTNGKTTSAFLMRELLASSGRKTALLGTICNQILDEKIPSSLTTPGLLDLYAFAASAKKAGATDLVMEVSSHALHQGRVAGLSFSSALFSNLTQDHLDYHETLENYFQAKTLLFTQYLSEEGIAVINVDSPYGERLLKLSRGKVLSVSRLKKAGADIFPSGSVLIDENGISFLLPQISREPFVSKLCGEFNVDNAMLVLAWACALGLSLESMRAALLNIRVPGRFEKVYDASNLHVIVDYAHTPDALERVLQTARALCRGNLLVVFGCGGDRDKTKRPQMGKIASENADKIFVTSDNPRTEDPKKIIEEIAAGISGEFVLEIDRRAAIRKAIQTMQPNDWLVIAGKGHEDYQILGTEKHHFDDAEEVRKVFET